MRRWLTIAALLLLIHTVSEAQFVPNNGQAFQFMPLYNPAFSGIENFQDLKISYRYQWTGLGADAPKFLNLSYTLRLKQPLDLTYNALRSSHTSTLSPRDYPKSKTLIHGLGVNAFHESYGPLKRTGGGLNYSLHYAIAKKMRLAAGIGIVYEGQSIGKGITYRDPNDPLAGIAQKQSMISARAGVLLYSNTFYLGVSYLPVWSLMLEEPETAVSQSFYKGTVQGGVSLQLTPEFVLKPSVMLLLQTDDKLLIDYSAKAFIQQRLWVGVTYRDIQAAIVSAGFEISNAMSVSYAYELSTSGLKQFNDASHELVLSVRLNNFKRQKQFTW